MSKMALKLFLNSDSCCDFYNALNNSDLSDKNGDDTSLVDAVLSKPSLKKEFLQLLKDSGIHEGITENTVEAGFDDWFIDKLEQAEITISINFDSENVW